MWSSQSNNSAESNGRNEQNAASDDAEGINAGNDESSSAAVVAVINGEKTKRTSRILKSRKAIKGISDTGWFSEVEAMWPGQKFSLALEGFSQEASVLHSSRSNFQEILVFKSAQYGNVMALDGVIQLTERDEFSYHEAMVHIPLFAHSNPKNVLIVGGGDGGVLREVCKHQNIENITLVEIDPMVIKVGKEFFANSTATCFDDPRLTIVNEDAAEYLQKMQEINDQRDMEQKGNNNNTIGGGDGDGNKKEYKTTVKYDVIFSDSSDPSGPAETLFQPSFFEQMNDMLNEGGIICAQCECVWIHLDLIADIVACCADIFDSVEYITTSVPTYPCGQIGFVLACRGRGSCRIPAREPTQKLQNEQLKWYNTEMHSAAFVLPQFVEEKLAPLRPLPYEEDEENSMVEDCFLRQCTVT